MTKPTAKVEVNSFVKGIITEASPLNFPANASLDEQNFELIRDGTRKRRLGMDFEAQYVLHESGQTTYSVNTNGFSTFNWKGAAGKQANQFAVVQFGNKLTFFRTTKDSISKDGLEGSLTLASFSPINTYSYAAVDGYLIVTGGFSSIAVISFVNGGFSVDYQRLLTRDLWGVEVPDSKYETDIMFRGQIDAIPKNQVYNYRNQSWALPRRVGPNWMDPIYAFWTNSLLAPANVEAVWDGMAVDANTGREGYDGTLSMDVFGSKTSVAKGFFIIDLLERGASRYEKVQAIQADTSIATLKYLVDSPLPQDKSSGGASVVENYAGRVFYAGFDGEVTGGDKRSPNLSNMIFFSKIVKNQTDIIKCYQEGDPTSREASDIVDTDGGFIRIAGANNIRKLINIGNILIAICGNGVWAIKGGADYGFTATNYMVEKLSSFGSESPNSVISTGDSLFFWSYNGICIIAKDKFGEYKLDNISYATVQTLFDEIPTEVKQHVVGVYDEYDKNLKWLVKETPNKPYVTEIIFDIVLSAFTKYKISCVEADVLGYVQTPGFTTSSSDEFVVVENDAVLVNTDAVLVDYDQRYAQTRSVKYLASLKVDGSNIAYYSFAEYNNGKFKDWLSVSEGYDAKGYILTGALTAGDSGIEKQVPYITTHMMRTENGVEEIDSELVPKYQSGCLLRSQWSWANSVASNKWSPSFQIYRYRKPLFIVDGDDAYDNGFELVSSKNKLRGRGKAISLYFETEEEKDCHILGWAMQVTGNNQ